jgi:hypothetical protein
MGSMGKTYKSIEKILSSGGEIYNAATKLNRQKMIEIFFAGIIFPCCLWRGQ